MSLIVWQTKIYFAQPGKANQSTPFRWIFILMMTLFNEHSTALCPNSYIYIHSGYRNVVCMSNIITACYVTATLKKNYTGIIFE